MRERLLGYWALSWVGLIGNIIALPIIALMISYGPPLKVANITLAISLGWPAALNRLVFSEKKNSIHPQFDNLENSNNIFLSNKTN